MNNVPDKLIELLRAHLHKDRFGQKEMFCTHWLSNDYFAGWYKKGDTQVHAYRITYPASAPAGFVRVGQARMFQLK